MSWLVRAAVLLPLALLAAGCGGPGRPDERGTLPGAPAASPGPPPAPPAPPDPSAGAVDALRAWREEAEALPPVKAALALSGRDREDAARRTWGLARRELVAFASRSGLRELVARLDGLPPSPAGFDELARLALIERLLSVSEHEDAEPVFPGAASPGLALRLARGIAIRWEPSMDGRRTPDHRVRRQQYSAALSKAGRSWKTLRQLEDAVVPDGPAKGFNSRLRRQNPAGEPYRDPTEEVPALVLDGVYRERDRERLRLAPDRLVLETTPPREDLFLAITVWNLFTTSHLEISLVGRDQTVLVLVSQPTGPEAEPGPPPWVPSGYAVRVRREVVPAGLRRIAMRIVGLQPIGRPEPAASLTEVLQQQDGPPPEVFRDHSWLDPTPAKPLDRLAEERLQNELRPLLEKIQADRSDAESRALAGRLLLEAGRAEPARDWLLAADGLRPDHPATLALLGRASLALGDQEAARALWSQSFRLDPRGPALPLLQKHAPGLLATVHRLGSGEEFLQFAAFRADFRRQDEVGVALARFNSRKGVNLGLVAANSASLVDDLFKRGWLERAGGPPSRKGIYLTDAAGGIHSTAFGSPAEPIDPPPALRASLLVEIPPAVLLAALETCRPEAWELGMTRLANEEAGRAFGLLAGPCAALRDPWAIDAVLAVVRRTLARGESDEAKMALPFLRRLAAEAPERIQAWSALGLLFELGERKLPPVPAGELDALMTAVSRGRVPRGAARAAIEGGGKAGLAWVEAKLKGPSAVHFALAAELMPHVGGKAQVGSLVQAFDNEAGEHGRRSLVRSLEAMTGKKLGSEAAAWQAWWKEGGR